MATTRVAGSSLAKHLASCNKTTRDKAILLLKTWLPSQPQISQHELKNIWKGLFYCIWHTDKQQFQIDLINRLASLLVSLDLSLSIQYFQVFLLTMRREWSGIDYLRLDKFYLLNRRFLHHLFLLFKNNSWDVQLVEKFMSVLEEKTLLSVDRFPAHGFNYHLAEVLLEQLTPFLPLSLEVVGVVLKPFISVLGKSSDKVLLDKIKSGLFGFLLENGKKLLERKKLGEEAKEGGADEVELFGTLGLTLGLSKQFFDLGSSVECVQGNRKILFSLHEEFLKLENDFANSGFEISPPQMSNEDKVPELVPISHMEVEANGSNEKQSTKSKKVKKAEVSVELVEKKQVVNGSISKAANKIKKAKKASPGSGTETKKSRKLRNSPLGSGVLDGGNGSGGESVTKEGGLINFDESVISNLQMQFEKIAAEVGMGKDGASSIGSPETPTVSTLPQKRKRVKNINEKVPFCDGLLDNGVIGGNSGGKSVEKSAKKVKFSMKSNVVWKPHTPLPPQSLRIPPSATPRGSALKKGIPAGPVIGSPTMGKMLKQRMSPLKKARKSLKTVSPSVKRLKKLRS